MTPWSEACTWTPMVLRAAEYSRSPGHLQKKIVEPAKKLLVACTMQANHLWRESLCFTRTTTSIETMNRWRRWFFKMLITVLPDPISVVRKRSTQQININGLANCWFHRQRLEEQYIQKCWQSIMFITFLSPVTRGHGTQTLYRHRATQRDRAKVCQCSVRKTFACKPFLPGQAQDAKSVLQVETAGRSGNCCEICGSLGCYGFVLRWLKIWWKRGRLVEDILGGTICIVFKYFLSLPLLWVRMFSNTPGNDRFRVRFHRVARRISLAIWGI